jgi:HTH-type transcriptional regulator/antitoxin HigA
MLSADLEKTIEVWPVVADVIGMPHTEEEYERAINWLDELIDQVGEDETHPLASLMETLGALIEIYEAKYVPELEGDPLSSLKMLLVEHEIGPTELSEIGSVGEIEEILRGDRELTLTQIRLLSERFHVSPLVFM